MDTSRDGEAGARADILLFSFVLVFFSRSDTSSSLNEVPDPMDIGEAGSDGHSVRRKGAVDYARFVFHIDLLDRGRIHRDGIWSPGQLLYLPVVSSGKSSASEYALLLPEFLRSGVQHEAMNRR